MLHSAYVGQRTASLVPRHILRNQKTKKKTLFNFSTMCMCVFERTGHEQHSMHVMHRFYTAVRTFSPNCMFCCCMALKNNNYNNRPNISHATNNFSCVGRSILWTNDLNRTTYYNKSQNCMRKIFVEITKFLFWPAKLKLCCWLYCIVSS